MSDNVGALAFTALLFLGGAVIYFFPFIVTNGRRHRQQVAILVLNLCLGWTFIGWVVALVWEFTADVKDVKKAQARSWGYLLMGGIH